jgi:uncharacterized protein with GYD domain
MATFITTLKFSQQGVANIKDTAKRAAAFKAAAKKMGVKVRDIFWTLGAFDGAIVFDSPDDETATALMLYIGMQGNVQTQTARAFTDADIEKMLVMIPK